MKQFTSSRYTCTCDPEIRDDIDKRYARQVTLEIPEGIHERNRRIADGLPPTVSIDQCIVGAIKELWRHKINTLGCCCGHNRERAWVQVHRVDYVRMLELGYEQRPVEVVNGHAMGLYCFYL